MVATCKDDICNGHIKIRVKLHFLGSVNSELGTDKCSSKQILTTQINFPFYLNTTKFF